MVHMFAVHVLFVGVVGLMCVFVMVLMCVPVMMLCLLVLWS